MVCASDHPLPLEQRRGESPRLCFVRSGIIGIAPATLSRRAATWVVPAATMRPPACAAGAQVDGGNRLRITSVSCSMTTVAPWSSRVWNSPKKGGHVQGSQQADGGSPCDEEGVRLAGPSRWPASAAGLPRRRGWGWPPPGEVPQPRSPGPRSRWRMGFQSRQAPPGPLDVHGHDLGEGGRRPVLGGGSHLVGLFLSYRSPAGGAGDVHIRRNCTSRLTLSVPSQVGQRRRPVL